MSEAKRGRGRPKVIQDADAIVESARLLKDSEVCEQFGISLSTLMRFKREHGPAIEAARARSAYSQWLAIERACSGKGGKRVNIGAATMLLRRLERGER